ncbi:MAG: hypothetical protein AB1751_10990 [Acidobacteriota bacterium]
MVTRNLAARWTKSWLFPLCFLAAWQGAFAASPQWKPLGPFGGVVTAVAVDPWNPQVVFAGTENGGIFKSVDGGRSWRPSSSGLEAGNIRGLVFDPENPGVMYAATVAGLFKSADGGKTWFSVGEGLGREAIDAVAVDPWQSTHLLAGNNTGIFWSNDAGASWLKVPSWFQWWSLEGLAFAPSDPRVVYAASVSGVAKSVDGGWSWQITALTSPANWALAVDPRNANVVYVGGYSGVKKSTDGGQTWFAATDGLGWETVWCLAQSPRKPDILYAGTVRGVYKTENAGGYWQRANLGMQGIWVKALAVDPGRPDTVYAGTQTGFYRTTNGGKSWAPAVEGLSATTVDAVAVDPQNPQTIYCIAREDPYGKGAIWKTGDRGRSWTLVRPLDWQQKGLDLLVDPDNSRTVYAVVHRLGLLKSVDGGSSWSVKTPAEFAYITAAALDPQDGNKVYLARGMTLFASGDGGESWVELSEVPLEWYEGISRLPEVSVLAVHPQKPHLLFAGGSNGEIFRSTNGGSSWIAAQLPEQRGAVSSIAFSPEDPERIYAATAWGLWVSNDGGQSFTLVPGLGNARLSSVVLAGNRGELVVVGIFDAGVTISFDGGQTWVGLNAGLTCRNVKKLLAEPQRPLSLLAATAGGGVFELSLANPPRRLLRPRNGEGP